MSTGNPNDRRWYARIKVSVPVEIQTDAGGSPIRGATVDLSLSGCYIETIFPMPIGTNLDLQLSIETTVLIAATVVTCDPQVGNGLRFIRMLPEDREALEAFLLAAQQAQDSRSRAAGGSEAVPHIPSLSLCPSSTPLNADTDAQHNLHIWPSVLCSSFATANRGEA